MNDQPPVFERGPDLTPELRKRLDAAREHVQSFFSAAVNGVPTAVQVYKRLQPHGEFEHVFVLCVRAGYEDQENGVRFEKYVPVAELVERPDLFTLRYASL